MTGSENLYPSLCRYFENMTELAHAGCMSRTRLNDILHGRKVFTRSEKKAIAANIVMKLFSGHPNKCVDYKEVNHAYAAWKGQFDEIYRRKEST